MDYELILAGGLTLGSVNCFVREREILTGAKTIPVAMGNSKIFA